MESPGELTEDVLHNLDDGSSDPRGRRTLRGCHGSLDHVGGRKRPRGHWEQIGIVPLGHITQTASALELCEGEVIAHFGGLQGAALLTQEAVNQGLGLPVRAELGLHLHTVEQQILSEVSYGLHPTVQAGQNLPLQGLPQVFGPFLQGGGRRCLVLDVRDLAQPQLILQFPGQVFGLVPLPSAVHPLTLEIPRCDSNVDVRLPVPGIRVDPSMVGAPHIAKVLQGHFHAPEHLRGGQALAGCRPQDDVRDLVLQRRTIVQPAKFLSNLFRDLARHIAVQLDRAVAANVVHTVGRTLAVDHLADHDSPRTRSRKALMSPWIAKSRSSRRPNSSRV